MLRDNSVFSQVINDVIEERIGNQEDTIDLRYLTDGALQNGGDGISLSEGGIMDEILPIDGSPLGSSFDYASIHEEANLNQEILKEKSAHLEQTDELEL